MSTFTTIADMLQKVLRAFGDLDSDILAMANAAVQRYPDLAEAREAFIRDYASKWEAELTEERAAARGALIWSELRDWGARGVDTESGSSA